MSQRTDKPGLAPPETPDSLKEVLWKIAFAVAFFRLDNRHDAEEVAQNSIMIFDKRSKVMLIDYPRAFIRKVAWNESRTFILKARKVIQFSQLGKERPPDPNDDRTPTPQDSLLEKERLAMLARILAELNPDDQELIQRRMNGATNQEIARHFSLTEAGASQRYTRCIAKARARAQELGMLD